MHEDASIHVQDHCSVLMVSSENLCGGAVNFLNLSGFARKIYTLVSASYYCILDLHFDIHYLNNPMVNQFLCIFLKTATFITRIKIFQPADKIFFHEV